MSSVLIRLRAVVRSVPGARAAARLGRRLYWHPKLRRLVWKPRVATVRTFVPDGCKFEIRYQSESFRTEQFGGEEDFIGRILREVKPGDVIFDVGACVGLVSIHAAKLGARVVAFEPDPHNRSRLIHNVRLNQISSEVQVVHWAASDASGEVALYSDGVEGRSPSLREEGSRGKLIVETRPIDLAIEARELPKPDIVKMDIEGAEILALRGMRKLLSSPDGPRIVFIEVHPAFLPAFGANEADVTKLLQGSGYLSIHSAERDGQQHYIFERVTRRSA